MGEQGLSHLACAADAAQITQHPWSLGGGGVGELVKAIEETPEKVVGDKAVSYGRTGHTGDDEAYVAPFSALKRSGVEVQFIKTLVEGDKVRDWILNQPVALVFPYTEKLSVIAEAGAPMTLRFLWRFRTQLWERREPNGTHREIGFTWYQLSRFHPERFVGLGISVAEVATHNHFVLDRGGKVFKQTAPVIKLPEAASEDDYLHLLGLLNSSTHEFWAKQVCHNKGSSVDQYGARQTSAPFENFFQRNSTRISEFPIALDSRDNVTALARDLDVLGHKLVSLSPSTIGQRAAPTKEVIAHAQHESMRIRLVMIFLQEELDWLVYQAYGLLKPNKCPRHNDPPLALSLGERAFEIVLARKIAAGKEQSAWFTRHGSTPISELPAAWPDEYRQIVQRRIALIEAHPFIKLLERPEHKRRWSQEPWDEQVANALREWLCDRLEGNAEPAGTNRVWPTEAKLISCAQLADRMRQDAEFLQVAELYRGTDNFDLQALVIELVRAEAVPYLPQYRYTESGLRKRHAWEEVWALQRREDAGEKVSIPVPPRYDSKDFQAGVWTHRGKLDVPKERFILYPNAERTVDASPVITWAGYDHLQQARALSAYFVFAKEEEGWPIERLIPLLAGLDQLVPWIKQWHNEIDPQFNMRLGDFFKSDLEDEAFKLGVTVAALREWTPPARTTARKPRKKKEGTA